MIQKKSPDEMSTVLFYIVSAPDSVALVNLPLKKKWGGGGVGPTRAERKWLLRVLRAMAGRMVENRHGGILSRMP